MTSMQFWGYQPESKSVKLKNAKQPILQKGEVLVKNHAIGINPVDWKFIDANPLGWHKDHIPGVDGAGEIVAVYDDCEAHLIGKRVCYHAFLKSNGSFATHTAVKAERVMQLKETFSYSLAAALPCPMLTAFQAFEKIPVRKGSSILIAGLGAVTKILAQLLSRQGFNVDVISKYSAQTQKLGIRDIFSDGSAINEQYFAAFDAISELSAASLVRYLKANGHIICIQDRISQPVDPAFTRTISYHEIALGALHEFGDKQAWLDLMKSGESLIKDIAKNQLIVESPIQFPFEQIQTALSHSKKSREKTVLIFS